MNSPRLEAEKMRRIMQLSGLFVLASLFCFADEEHKTVLRVKAAPHEPAPEITMHMDADPTLRIVIENNTSHPFNYRVSSKGRLQGFCFTLLWRGKTVARTHDLGLEQHVKALKPKEKVEQIISFKFLNILPGPWRGPKWLHSGEYVAHIELEQAEPRAPDTPDRIAKSIRIIIE